VRGLVVAKAAEGLDPHVRVGATRVLEVAAAVESKGFSAEKQDRIIWNRVISADAMTRVRSH